MEEKLIAVVDDEPEVIKTLYGFLKHRGCRIKGFSDSISLFKFLDKEKPDLIILDLMLPGVNGYDICKNLKEKEKYFSIPVIILSANNGEPQKISLLDIGADDYVVKPFSLMELNARIKAVLRRYAVEETKKVKIGGIVMDLDKYEVFIDEDKIDVTSTEFKILQCLMSRKGQVFTRDRILDYLWCGEKIVVERTIDVHIRHLREKMGKFGETIKNVRGIGYKIDDIQ